MKTQAVFVGEASAFHNPHAIHTVVAGEVADRKSASHGEAGYERRDRDAYFTPPWVTQALLSAFPTTYFGSPVWEPACGDGRMVEVLFQAGKCVCYSDIHDYGYSPRFFQKIDFLRDPAPDSKFDAVITNPPFDLARQFIRRAIDVVKPQSGKVAILQRHEFDAPKSNHPLFAWPFAAKLILPRRPQWADGPAKASPRFPYAWYVWDWNHKGPPILRYLSDSQGDKTGELSLSTDRCQTAQVQMSNTDAISKSTFGQNTDESER